MSSNQQQMGASKMSENGNKINVLPTLEMVLLAFQKGVARVTQATNDSSKHDPNFLTGKRTLYAVDSINIDLSAGVKMIPNEDGKLEDRVRIDFDAPEAERSRLQFSVEPKPLEPLKGPRIFLSRIDPLVDMNHRPNEFLVWYLSRKNNLRPDMPVTLIFTPTGKGKDVRKVETRTDLAGQLKFKIEHTGVFKSTCSFKPKNFKLNMTFDWLVTAKVEDQGIWESIVIPIYKKGGTS